MSAFMNPMLRQIEALGLVPVVKLDSPEDAIPLAQALCDGGLPCAEITFRTAAAAAAIRSMTEAFPHMLVGAGTVLTTQQAEDAIAAGAKFIVSPGLCPEVVTYCLSKKITVIPGCATPSDVGRAISLGLSTVKFFPAEQAGGLAMIKAMSAPYTDIRFMPTGGINETNLNRYLDFHKVLACGGSFMVPSSLIANKDFAQIQQLTRQAVLGMLDFSLAHVGINTQDQQQAQHVADGFSDLFGFPQTNGNSSVFVGAALEIMKTPFLGTHGHIAVKTRDVRRAICYFERHGCTFNQGTAKYDAKDQLKAIYFQQEYGGFAVHLLRS